MASAAAQTRLTPEDYITFERQEYILISQDSVRVEHYLRRETEWIPTEFRELTDVLPLISIDCTLPLQDIYRRVTF